jgi:hypothetical protein
VVAAGFAELAGALAAAADGPGQAGGVSQVVAIASATAPSPLPTRTCTAL